MNKAQLTSAVDQLSAAVQEIFTERGYKVKVSIAFNIKSGMAFNMDEYYTTEKQLTQEIVDDVVQEGAKRCGLDLDWFAEYMGEL